MRSAILVFVLGLFLGIGNAMACDGGKTCAQHTKGSKAMAACMKDGKCTMKDGKCDMKDGKCDMKTAKAMGCDMNSGHCNMKATKTGAKGDKAAAMKHSCCAPKTGQKS